MERHPVQLHLSSASALAERVAPVENADGKRGIFCKPFYGMWTSTWNEETRLSSWVEWCQSEFQEPLQDKHWFLLTPRTDIRLYTIDTLADLIWLIERYRRDMGARLGFMRHQYLDYERVAQDYDAVHLTEEGQWRTRLSSPADLYGWDCECTLWFRWCFERVEQIEPTVTAEV